MSYSDIGDLPAKVQQDHFLDLAYFRQTCNIVRALDTMLHFTFVVLERVPVMEVLASGDLDIPAVLFRRQWFVPSRETVYLVCFNGCFAEAHNQQHMKQRESLGHDNEVALTQLPLKRVLTQ